MKIPEDSIGPSGFTKLYALYLLSKMDMSGYELMSEIGKGLGKTPSSGQIYPLLMKMRHAGHLAVKSTGSRDKKVYSLTREGRKAVGAMMARTDGAIKVLLGDRLKKCVHCNCIIYENGYSRKHQGRVHHFCCPHCAAALDRCGKR